MLEVLFSFKVTHQTTERNSLSGLFLTPLEPWERTPLLWGPH